MRQLLIVFSLTGVMACGERLPMAPDTPSSPPAPAPKYNVIIVNTDDLSARTLEFGLGKVPDAALFHRNASVPPAQVHFPSIKTLASQSTTFDLAYVSAPICCPSRVSLLTGQYTKNHGIWFIHPPNGGFQSFYASGGEKETLAVLLQQAGWNTGAYGKYLNGYSDQAPGGYVPPGWNDWRVFDNSVGYSEYWLNENGQGIYYGTDESSYSTNVFFRHAENHMDKSIKDGKPFFVYLNPYAPHMPALPAPRHGRMFSEKTCEALRVLSFDEEDISDKPGWIHQRGRRMNTEEIRIADRGFCRALASMLAVDEGIGKMMAFLDQHKQLDRTIIIFTSDNGFMNGEHRLPDKKDNVYDEAARVPLIIFGPSLARGATLFHPVSNVDISPTVLDLLELPISDSIDGRPLTPLIKGNPLPMSQWRQAVLYEHFDDFSHLDDEITRSPIPPFKAIRTERYVYARFTDGGVNGVGTRIVAEELYDMQRDPLQLDNLFGLSTPPDTQLVTTLRQQLDRLAACQGAACHQ